MSKVTVKRAKPITGFNSNSVDNLLLDAGAFFKNFKFGTDTYASAKAAGKCLGATIKGGEFSAKPNYRRIEFDGVHTRTKGDTVLESWEVYIKATLAEMTTENIVHSLGVADSADASVEGYEKITGRDYIMPEDYIENITWVGNLMGSNEPIIIQIFNAFNENGLTLGLADKDNSTSEVQFYGNISDTDYDNGEEIKPPFAIYRPKITKQSTQEENNA